MAGLEPLHQRAERLHVEVRLEDVFHRLAQELFDHPVFLAVVLAHGEFDLAARTGGEVLQIADSRDCHRLAEQQAAALGVGHHVLRVGDRHADAHPRLLVDRRAGPGQAGHLLDDFLHVSWDADGHFVAVQPRVGVGDSDPQVASRRVVRPDHAADAVLQRRHDPAAVGVILGVGAEDDADVQVEPDRVPADLHVTLFKHVEQADLDARRQVRQFIDRAEDQAQVEFEPDREAADLDVALLQHVDQPDLDLRAQVRQFVDAEDAAVGPRDQSVVHRQFVGQVPALGVFDHVDLADQVGDGHVGRGQFFVVPPLPADPLDGRAVALAGDPFAGSPAERGERVVVHLAAGDDRNRVVE